MNARQLQYAILLSETLNFSQAADVLNISQPALSKQIINLEQELDVLLFDRNTNPLTLTPAGECFIQEARELLNKEEEIKHSMKQFKTGERARLTIGVTPFRSLYLMPQIIKMLNQKYPMLQIVLKENGNLQLQKDAIDGMFDFALINLPVDETLLDVTLLDPEKVVLAVPNELVSLLPPSTMNKQKQYPVISLADCENIPFITLGKQQELRKLFDKLCITANFKPTIRTEVVGVTTAWSMACAGVGATILPLSFLESYPLSKDLSFFELKHNSFLRQPAIITKKGQYISEYAKYAIDLLTK